jgi:hypothetical protein
MLAGLYGRLGPGGLSAGAVSRPRSRGLRDGRRHRGGSGTTGCRGGRRVRPPGPGSRRRPGGRTRGCPRATATSRATSNTGTSYSRSFRSDLRNQAKRGAQPRRVAIALTGDRQSGEDLLRPEQEMGRVAHLNYRDARKKRLTGSSGPPAVVVAGSRRRVWLNCHAPAKGAGHARGAGRDRVSWGAGYERSGSGPRTVCGPRSGKPAGPRSATKCRERTCCTGWRA